MNEIIESFTGLIKLFNYWSILMIFIVVILMIPINMLYKKIMSTEKLSRLRKTIAMITNYAICIGVIASATAIVYKETIITATYLFANAVTLSFCSQTIWEFIKLIRDYGFSKVMVLMSENLEWKKYLKDISKKFNIEEDIIDAIATLIEEKYLAEIETDALKAFVNNEKLMMQNIKTQLSSFAKAEDLNDLTMAVFSALKNSWGIDNKGE